MRPARDFLPFPFIGPGTQFDWDLALNQNIPTALELSVGANRSTMDLSDMNITGIKAQSGACDLFMKLPPRGRFKADFELGAASLTISIPDGLSARIHATLGAADINLDKTRFPRKGVYYESADYETAENAVDIKISAGAASVKIR